MLIAKPCIVALLAALAAASPAPAAPKDKASAMAQVDGITSRVVDNLWKTTDRYWHDGDYSRIVALTRICVEADPKFYEAWSSGAWLLWSMGDTAAADVFLKDGLSRNPDVYVLHHDFGWHLFNTKRYAEALPHLQAATRFADAPSQVWKTLGHCYDQLGRLDEAEAVWKTVTEKFPRDVAGPPNLERIREKRRVRQGQTP
jgi:Tfp pilus assembly protein PilF